MKQAHGFTAIELMVTVAVVAVLAALVVPNFRSLISQNRLTAQANDFLATVSYARTEAIKRGTRVTICRSTTTHQPPSEWRCAVGSGGGWETGWIIFAVAPTEAPTQPGSGERLRSKDSFGTTAHTMRSNSNVSNRITFSEHGMAPGFNGTLTLCDRSRLKARYIVISTTGRTRIADKPPSSSVFPCS